MQITFVSNFINHHQIPFCDAMYAIDDSFRFIATEEMSDERKQMGWSSDTSCPYVVYAYENPTKAQELIDNCDVLIVGWIRDESIVRSRLRSGKPAIRISERIYREGQWRFVSPKGLIAKYKSHTSLRKLPVYLLCNGAYVASDYSLIGAYKNKMYKFGYFPATRRYENVAGLWEKKEKLNPVEIYASEELPIEPPTLTDKDIQIVWAGRFIPLKHPEYMVRLAADMCYLGYRFHIHMIGGGQMEEELKQSAEYEMIEDYITFHGYASANEVRDIMEKCHIHIFTSNFLEGWGAVINEGMNAGLVPIANDETGAAPFLIKDGENGLLYHKGEYDDMKAKVVTLFENPQLIEKYGRAAYDTIVTNWNAEIAAHRVMDMCNQITNGHICPPSEGPLSVAELIKPDFWASGRLGE